MSKLCPRNEVLSGIDIAWDKANHTSKSDLEEVGRTVDRASERITVLGCLAGEYQGGVGVHIDKMHYLHV